MAKHRYPNIIHMNQRWFDQLNSLSRRAPDGKSAYPARVHGTWTVWHRLKATWLVFTGRADALIWPGGQ